MSKAFSVFSPPKIKFPGASVPSFAPPPTEFDPGAQYPNPRSAAEWEFQQTRGTAARTQSEWESLQKGGGPETGRLVLPPKPAQVAPQVAPPSAPPIPVPPQVPVAPPPPAPTPAAAAATNPPGVAAATPEREQVAAVDDEDERRKRRVGRAATILTSPRGLLGVAPVAKKTLLGA